VILLPQTVIDILMRKGSVRIEAAGLMPQTMQQYAFAAKSGGGFVEFVVGSAMQLPQTLNDISAAGGGHVRWDFVSKVN
jgi:hypothetical protein